MGWKDSINTFPAAVPYKNSIKHAVCPTICEAELCEAEQLWSRMTYAGISRTFFTVRSENRRKE